MRRAPDEVDVPGLGRLQWWSDSPYDQTHWYVSETQRAYRVEITEQGAGAVSDIDGKLIHRIVTPEPARVEEPVLL